MQEKKTQNPSLPVTYETMHGNQWKITQKQRGNPQCAGNPSHRVDPLGPTTFLNIREQLAGESLRYFLHPFSLHAVSTTGQVLL